MSDARFVMVVHGAIIALIVVGATIMAIAGRAPAELLPFVYGGALGYAGGRTMNNVRNGESA